MSGLEATAMKTSTCSSLKGQHLSNLSLQPTRQKEIANVYTLGVEYDETDRTVSRAPFSPSEISSTLSGKQRWWTDNSRFLLSAPQRGTNSNAAVSAIRNQDYKWLSHIEHFIELSCDRTPQNSQDSSVKCTLIHTALIKLPFYISKQRFKF